MSAQQVSARGRPSKLTPELADRLVELLAGGMTVTAAAAAVGISRRTVQHWRARAWSREPRDQPHVALEQCLHAARVSAAARAAPPLGDDWQVAAARLEVMHPTRWGPVGPPDDLLGDW